MISETLRRARTFEEENLPAVPAQVLPAFHVTGIRGWINDPNGFSLYKGEYHLFFQYHPYSNQWGPMHWGHVKSKDMIRWERLPAALAPDADYDRDGCFSGSGIELPDGRHLLLYTGVRKDQLADGTESEYQTQCVAIGDGINYEKYAGNPVIRSDAVPEGGSTRDFRDPKIWRQDGRYYAVVGDRCSDGSGAILLYESEDALRWRYDGTIASSRNRFGRMWECPDFFPLDGKHVLLVSPQEMLGQGLEFLPGNETLCQIGTYDPVSHQLTEESIQAIDYGLDFYATQTLQTADGRRVMIAWMQYWGSIGCCRADLPFFGQMILPRELGVRHGRLIQNPIRELEAYRGKRTAYQNVDIDGIRDLPDIGGRCLDLTVTVRPREGEALYQAFRLDVARDETHVTSILYRPAAGTVLVDRSRSELPAESAGNTREFSVRDRGGEIKLRLLLDRYSLELFVNDGEQAASFTLYTHQSADGISFRADGAVQVDVEQYLLDFS